MKKRWIYTTASLIALLSISVFLFWFSRRSEERPEPEVYEKAPVEIVRITDPEPEPITEQIEPEEPEEIANHEPIAPIEPLSEAGIDKEPLPAADDEHDPFELAIVPIEIGPIDLPELRDIDYEKPRIGDELTFRPVLIELDESRVRDPDELQPMTEELLGLILEKIPEAIAAPETSPNDAQEIIAITEPDLVDSADTFVEAELPDSIEIPPFLHIESPLGQRFYRSEVSISFSVYNDENQDRSDRVESIYWFSPDGVKTELPVDSSQSYTLIYNSKEHTGPLSIKIEAIKDNGLIDEVLLEFEEDLKGPAIDVFSPLADEQIDRNIVIEGSVFPKDGFYVPVSEISSLVLVIPGSESPVDLSFDEYGLFSYELEDHKIEGLDFLTFEATDKNGHTSSHSVPVRGRISESIAELIPPVIRIDSPDQDSFYYSQIEISGSVFNSSLDGSANLIRDFYWTIAGEDGRNSIDFERDGGFNFRITAVDMNRNLQLLFTAVKEDGGQSNYILSLKNDKTGPNIIIDSPVQDQYFGQTLKVKGIVEDYVGRANEVKSLYWSVSSLPGERNLIFFEDDGSFDFDINTEFIEGKISFRISAADLNNNITDLSIELNDGKKAPVIVLDSPAQGDEYGAGIKISGKISDPYSWNPDFGGIANLKVIISPADAVASGEVIERDVPLDSNGGFGYILPATGRTGDQKLEIQVLARNGNQSLISMNLEQSEYSIPDFAIEQGDEQLVLRWTEMPFIENYKLLVTIEDNENVIENVRSPLVLKNLINGKLYRFHLTGLKGTDTAESPILGSIPLNDRTLEPYAQSEFGFIEVSWLPIEGSSSYKILRSDEAGIFSDISGEIPDTRFIDKSGIFGKIYSYKVVPYGYEQIPSYSVEGKLLSEPPLRLNEKGSLSNIEPKDLVIDGDYAYVVSEEEGFYIIDISNPEKMEVRGFHLVSGANGVSLIDDYAIITAGSNGFYLVNIAEPASPRQVSFRKTTEALASDARDEFVFIADGQKGLKVYSLSNPLRPPRLTADDSFPAFDVTVVGDRLYQSTGESGLIIWNISDPYYPELIVHFDEVPVFNCEIQDNYAFVASRENGVSIIDVSNEEEPFICSTYQTENAQSLTVKDTHLYIADGEGGLIDLDITDPYRPVTFESMDFNYASSVDSRNNLVVVADRKGLKSVETFQFGQSFKIGELKTEGNASSVEVFDGIVYISDHSGGLVLVDGSDPTGIDQTDVLFTIPTEYAESVYIDKGRIYLADGAGGVRVYAIKDDELLLLETIEIEGQAKRVVEHNGLIYIAAGRGGVQGAETLPGNESGPGASEEAIPLEADDREIKKAALWSVSLRDVRDIVPVGSYLYCADRQRGLIILEISVSGTPEILKEIDLPGATALSLEDDRLYVAHGEGVSIYHIEDKTFPEEIKTLESPYVEDIYVEGSILYVAEGHGGLSIYEVKDDGSIIKVSECLDVFADSVTVSGEYAYIADSTGINIVKIHIPQWIRQRQ